MADMDRDLLIAEFQNITGCDTERAQFYLESANMKLDLAVSSFFENDGELPEAAPGLMGEDQAQSGAAAPAGSTAAAGGQQQTPGTADRIGVLGDSSDEDEEGQAFYAGGSTSSGNVILGPKKNKKRDIVADVFKKAKESGAEQVEAGESSAPGPSKTKAFSGGGFTLGDESTPSAKMGGAPTESKPQQRSFVLKMWQNGFSLDDGELRAYDEPGNREFLACIMKGKIPQELVREAKGGEVHLDMEDHRNEEYVKPKVKPKPFQGSGQVLGSIAPQVVGTPGASASATSNADGEETAKAQLATDDSQPTTSIQVRLADGTRLVVRMNHTHTIGQLRSYIQCARPQYAQQAFALMTTFPPAELTDDNQTVKAAGIMNAAVMQRLK